MNDSSSTTRYQVGDLCIDVGRGTVCRNGAEVEFSQLSFSLFLRLVEADGGIVTLETLISDVWPGVVVTPVGTPCANPATPLCAHVSGMSGRRQHLITAPTCSLRRAR